jgi:purine-binding chemotaxis protein CheW
MAKVNNQKESIKNQKKTNSKISRFSVFIVSEKLFGIELSKVIEVIPLPKISKIPSSPKHILGVFNLRGTILTLLEINETLGIHAQDTEENMVLVIEHLNQKIGILVDKVLDVINVDESEIQLPSREMSPKMATNILGYYEKEGVGIINLLKLNELLTPHNFS